MALPPTIPTSFVPKQPVGLITRRPKSGTNVFLLLSLFVAGAAVVVALATFGYQTYLESSRDTKAAQLKQAEDAIDTDTVEGFIRLRNRLQSSRTILDEHVTLSQLFDVLETRTLKNVRFDSLTISIGDDRGAELQLDGVARSINALAAQSNEFAAEKRIKRAIFSGITPKEDGTISFKLSAEIDPKLVVGGTTGTAGVMTAPSATTTKPSATTPAATTPAAAPKPASAPMPAPAPKTP